MPASSTITAFNTFVQNTRARASQVNVNFDNFRGHLVPINTDSVSASDLTHDLGSDEHRWRFGYVGGIDFETATTTATLLLSGDTSWTSGAFKFSIEGTEEFRIENTGPVVPFGRSLKIKGTTTTGDWVISHVGDVFNGLTFQLNNNTYFAISGLGLSQNYMTVRGIDTAGSGSALGTDIVQTPLIDFNAYPSTGVAIGGSTCTIYNLAGRPVRVSFVAGVNGGAYYGIGSTSGVLFITGTTYEMNMNVMRGSVTIGAVTIRTPTSHYAATSSANFLFARFGPGELCVDLNPGTTSGVYNYSLQLVSNTNVSAEFNGVIFGRLQTEVIF